MIITSPETIHTSKSEYRYLPGATRTVFIAGGITGAPNWQPELAEAIDSPFWIIFNPRRKQAIEWKASSDAREQIEWEYWNLKTSDIVVFWFPKEAQCVITLFELGKEIGRLENVEPNKKKKIIVGVEPGFWREFDVYTQIGLSKENIPTFSNMQSMIDYINQMKY